MRYMLAWATLSLPLFLITAPTIAQDKAEKEKPAKAEKGEKPEKAMDQEKKEDKYLKIGSIQGKVVTVYEDTRKLRIKVPYQKLDVGQAQALARAQNDLSRARNPQEAFNARNAMAQAQAKLYTTDWRDMDVQAVEDVVVRTSVPREDFDDKGRVKKLTAAELKEQKGDNPNLPGFTAEFSDLKPEQAISLTVVRKKGEPAPKPMKLPKGGKDKDKENLEALLQENMPQISLIIFTPPPTFNGPIRKGR